MVGWEGQDGKVGGAGAVVRGSNRVRELEEGGKQWYEMLYFSVVVLS